MFDKDTDFQKLRIRIAGQLGGRAAQNIFPMNPDDERSWNPPDWASYLMGFAIFGGIAYGLLYSFWDAFLK